MINNVKNNGQSMSLKMLIKIVMVATLCSSSTPAIVEQIGARSGEYKDHAFENRLLKISRQNTSATHAKMLWSLLNVLYKPSSLTKLLPNINDTPHIKLLRNELEQFSDSFFDSLPYVGFQTAYMIFSVIQHLNQAPHGNMALLERLNGVLQYLDKGFLCMKMGELIVFACFFYSGTLVK